MTARAPAVNAAGILLFCLSLLVLVLEVTQVRIFSYSLDPQTVYMAISVAMLGIGVSAVTLACVPRLRSIEPVKVIAASLILFGASALVSNLLFSNVSDFVTHFLLPQAGLTLVSPTVLVFLICSVPYFFAGIGIAIGILGAGGSVGTNYCLNMVGSGLGCAIVFPLLSTVGAEAAVCLVAGSAMLLGALYSWRFSHPAALAALAGVALCAYLGANRDAFEFAPDAGDFPSLVSAPIIAKHGPSAKPTRTFAAWDPIGKVELYQWPYEDGFFHQDVPVKLFTQDAGSISLVLGFGANNDAARSFVRGSTYGAGTLLRPGGNVLVIGLGGAPDVLAALANRAAHVTAVDINAAAVAAIKYKSVFVGLDQVAAELSLVHADGRNYVESHRNAFDVIQMTGAETWSAGYVSGSVLSENYLYTREAFTSMFGALRPDGILAVTRFSNEPIRNASTALDVLRSFGVTDPSRHIIVLAQGTAWGTILAKRSAFTAEEIDSVRTFAKESEAFARANTLPLFEEFGFGISAPVKVIYLPGEPTPAAAGGKARLYAGLMRAADENRLTEWYAVQSQNYQPTTDDKPFFFQLDWLKPPTFKEIRGGDRFDPYRWNPVGGYIGLTFQFAVLALCLIVGPVMVLRGRAPATPGSFRLAFYFLVIGFGFMFIEIGLMQKLTLLLGHPTYAISTVLFSILVSTGLGSYMSQRWTQDSARGLLFWALPAILVSATLFLLFSSSLLPGLIVLSRPARILIAALLVAPIGFFMGFPYPTILMWLEARHRHFTPWAIAINSFASVLASVACIPLSSYLGFRAVLAIGIGMYAAAWLSVPAGLRQRTPAGNPAPAEAP